SGESFQENSYAALATKIRPLTDLTMASAEMDESHNVDSRSSSFALQTLTVELYESVDQVVEATLTAVEQRTVLTITWSAIRKLLLFARACAIASSTVNTGTPESGANV